MKISLIKFIFILIILGISLLLAFIMHFNIGYGSYNIKIFLIKILESIKHPDYTEIELLYYVYTSCLT